MIAKRIINRKLPPSANHRRGPSCSLPRPYLGPTRWRVHMGVQREKGKEGEARGTAAPFGRQNGSEKDSEKDLRSRTLGKKEASGTMLAQHNRVVRQPPGMRSLDPVPVPRTDNTTGYGALEPRECVDTTVPPVRRSCQKQKNSLITAPANTPSDQGTIFSVPEGQERS